MGKKVIIIGAGIAGMTAGIHLQRNGYDTEIFELHSLPGGLCTAWQRKGYTIDGCLHWLVGSSPGHRHPLHQQLEGKLGRVAARSGGWFFADEKRA